MVGKRVRMLRKKHKDTLRTLANKISYPYSSIGKIERGEMGASEEFIGKICKHYGVSKSYLFGEDVPEELKKVGVEWIEFAHDMTEKELTPDEIRAAVDLILKFRNEDK